MLRMRKPALPTNQQDWYWLSPEPRLVKQDTPLNWLLQKAVLAHAGAFARNRKEDELAQRASEELPGQLLSDRIVPVAQKGS